MKRLNSILNINNREKQIYETEFLILRYQLNCLEMDFDEDNQYKKDLEAIKGCI